MLTRIAATSALVMFATTPVLAQSGLVPTMGTTTTARMCSDLGRTAFVEVRIIGGEDAVSEESADRVRGVLACGRRILASCTAVMRYAEWIEVRDRDGRFKRQRAGTAGDEYCRSSAVDLRAANTPLKCYAIHDKRVSSDNRTQYAVTCYGEGGDKVAASDMPFEEDLVSDQPEETFNSRWSWLLGSWHTSKGAVVEFYAESDETVSGRLIRVTEELEDHGYRVGIQVYKGCNFGGRSDRPPWKIWAKDCSELRPVWTKAKYQLDWSKAGIMFIGQGTDELSFAGGAVGYTGRRQSQ